MADCDLELCEGRRAGRQTVWGCDSEWCTFKEVYFQLLGQEQEAPIRDGTLSPRTYADWQTFFIFAALSDFYEERANYCSNTGGMIHHPSTPPSKGAASSSACPPDIAPRCVPGTLRRLTCVHVFSLSVPGTSTQSITLASSPLWLCTGSPRWRWRPTGRPACLWRTCGDCPATKPLKSTARGEVAAALRRFDSQNS